MAARPKITGRKVPDDADAYSIGEFCARHRISVQLFYKNRSQMPRTFNVGTRVLVSKESAARWRAERERAAVSTAEAKGQPSTPQQR
jgi:hypothetical protein